jgi:vacuolar-type H+-ATPase subunit E/Vma4
VLTATATAALGPVRTALLDAARADAAAVHARAKREAEAILRDATGRAEAILDEARARGRAEAGALLAVEDGRTHRNARQAELAARRENLDALRARVAALLRERFAGPEAARLDEHLRAQARQFLGDEAVITALDGGGVVGRAPGRFVDASVAVLAERAVEALGASAERLWRG